MFKNSNKRKRRRERRRRELERLRGSSSLVDASTPTPKLNEGSTISASPQMEYGNPEDPSLATTAAANQSSTLSTTLPHHQPQHPPPAKHNHSTQQQSSTATSVMDIPLLGPTAPTWKRVNFVFPGSQQRQFVFGKGQQSTTGIPQARPDANDNGDKAQSDKKHKQKETIEDILYSDKRQKAAEEPETGPSSVQIAERKAIHDMQNRGPSQEETPLSAPRLRKLESTFERVHRESIDETQHVEASNFVDLPQQQQQQQQQRQEQSLSSIPEERSKQQKEKSKDTKQQKHGKKRPPEQEVPIDHLPKRGKISGISIKEAVQNKRGLRPRANSTDGELNLPQGGLCDERSILETYRWRHEAQLPPRGFHNMGNTCYLNSTLQCLAHVPPFCQTLVAITLDKMKRRKDGQLYRGQRVTSYLSKLFRQVHGLNNSSKPGPLAPRDIVNALPTIGQIGGKGGYQFRPGRQEDAHEFLVHLLDAMHDGELRASGINQHATGWRDGLPVTRLDETTFMHRIFGGYFRSQVRCPKCNYRSNTYDPFLDLSLEISKKSSNSVNQALQQFTRKETLDSDNKWRCDGCKKYVCPNKQLTVFRPPLALCIQLKRFAFNGGGSPFGMNGYGYYGFSKLGGGGGSKISKPIEFPANLDLPLSDNRSCAYSLTGIVIHVGGSASSGHYTAYVKRPGRAGTPPQWYHIDDDCVSSILERDVLRQKDAYLLFYSRKEVKIEYPTPPTRSMTAAEATEFGRNRARARAESFSKDDRNADDTKPSASTPVLQKKEIIPTKTTPHPLAAPTQAGQNLGDKKFNASLDSSSTSSDSNPSSNGKEQASNRKPAGDVSGNKPVDAAAPTVHATFPTAPPTRHGSSDSSTSGSSSDDSSDDEEDKGGGREGAYFGEPKSTPQEKPKKVDKERVVIDSSDSRGKVKVMMKSKKRKPWESKATALPSKEKNYQLLGNMKVSRWDEEESDGEDGDNVALLPKNRANADRQKIVENIHKQDSARKRKMHSDRWDSHLDQGRQKKVKSSTNRPPESELSSNPKKNRFHQIQSGVQRMVRGKPKGHVSSQKKNGKKHNKPHRNFGFRQGFGKF